MRLLFKICGVLFLVSFLICANPSANSATKKGNKGRTTISNSNESLKSIFQSSIGKYPYKINLLDKPALKKRLIKLVGEAGYKRIKRYFDVQLPIEFNHWNYHTEGWEAHNWGGNGCLISYNPESDNLCVKIYIDCKAKTYKEKQENAYWDYKN